MNLEKYTKAELISKLQKLQHLEKLEKSDLKKSSVKENIPTNDSKTKSDSSFWSILTKIKLWILSWAIITFLIRLFRNYKSLRNILRIINYVILSLFGVSMFQMLGGPMLLQLKNYFYVITQLWLETIEYFNEFLGRVFNQTDAIPSTRVIYKKPIDNDWKAEFKEADRQKALKEWMEKHGYKEKEESHYKMIILCILAFGAAVAIWWYGKDALDLLSPMAGIGEIIRNILRGDPGIPPAPPAPPAPLETPRSIKFDNPVRPISPDMLTYSSDMVKPPKEVRDKYFKESEKETEPIPGPSRTEMGVPDLLKDIQKGKKLKKTTVVKDDDNGEVNVNVSIYKKLENKLNKIRSVTGDDDDVIDDKWDDGDKTPTYRDIESPRSDKAELGIIDDNEKSNILNKGKEAEIPSLSYKLININKTRSSSDASMDVYFPKDKGKTREDFIHKV